MSISASPMSISASAGSASDGSTAAASFVEPPPPTGTGGTCYHFFPSGCPSGDPTTSSTEWVIDVWGPSNGFTGASGCGSRVEGQNQWCGTNDILFYFCCTCWNSLTKNPRHEDYFVCKLFFCI